MSSPETPHSKRALHSDPGFGETRAIFAARESRLQNGGLDLPDEEDPRTPETYPEIEAATPQSEHLDQPPDIEALTRNANLRWQELAHAEHLLAEAHRRRTAAKGAYDEAQASLDRAAHSTNRE